MVTRVKGIDISVFQNKISSYQAIRDSGVVFAYVRGLYGCSWDSLMDTHLTGLQNVGILVGVYQFTLPGDDAHEEARLVVQRESLDLPVTGDIETLNKHTAAEAQVWVHDYMAHIKEFGKRKPMIYTGKYFWDNSLGEDDNFGCSLFHAQYTTAATPSISKAWADWTMWQHLGNAYLDPNDNHVIVPAGTCPGISGDVDCNWFNGSLEELKTWAKSTWIDTTPSPYAVLPTDPPDALTVMGYR